MRRWNRREFLAATLALGGCAASGQPPLGPIYRPTHSTVDQPPLIVIPGAFGSSLRERRTGREIWPGSDRRLLVSSYRNLELDIDPATLEPVAGDVEAYDIFREGLGRDFYGRVVDVLRSAGGYVPLAPGQAVPEGRRGYYLYLYDWRLDNVTAVHGLHALVESIRDANGDPRLKVDVLAHSNGGLLARYYTRYGTAELPDSGPFRPDNAGAASIRRLLLVGTPNLGTLQPVLSLLRGEEMALRKVPQEVVATCAGATQLMPHPAMTWAVDTDGAPFERSLFDVDTWRANEWALWDDQVASRAVSRHGGGAAGRAYLATLRAYFGKQLGRGRRFMESLTAPAGDGETTAWVFGGDCEPTIARLICEREGQRWVARERIEDIAHRKPGIDYETLMFEPGDEVVTRSSLLGRMTLNVAAPRNGLESMPLAHAVFLCESHQQLTGNPSFQDNLLNALLSPDPG